MKKVLMLLLISSSCLAGTGSGTGGEPENESTSAFYYCMSQLASSAYYEDRDSGDGGQTEGTGSGTGGEPDETDSAFQLCMQDSAS